MKSHLGIFVPGKFASSHQTEHLRDSGRGVGWADTLLGSEQRAGRAKGRRPCCGSLGFRRGGGGLGGTISSGKGLRGLREPDFPKSLENVNV